MSSFKKFAVTIKVLVGFKINDIHRNKDQCIKLDNAPWIGNVTTVLESPTNSSFTRKLYPALSQIEWLIWLHLLC